MKITLTELQRECRLDFVKAERVLKFLEKKKLETQPDKGGQIDLQDKQLPTDIEDVKKIFDKKFNPNPHKMGKNLFGADVFVEDIWEFFIPLLQTLTEYKQTFDLQHKRYIEANLYWQKATGRLHTWNDLGELLKFLMDRIIKLETPTIISGEPFRVEKVDNNEPVQQPTKLNRTV